jgi:hypothetical protein
MPAVKTGGKFPFPSLRCIKKQKRFDFGQIKKREEKTKKQGKEETAGL